MEAAADLIYAEGWQFFWLAWAVGAALAAIVRCSTETVLVAFMLLDGWFLTNIFWQIPLVYIVSDAVFGLLTVGLWLQSREGHLLTVATVYASMLLAHGLSPGYPTQMVILNVLYGVQLACVTSAARRGAPHHGGGSGRIF